MLLECCCIAGVKSELCRALKATEASLTKQVEGSIKAANKRAEEERRKGSAKERAELEKVIAAQLGQVREEIVGHDVGQDELGSCYSSSVCYRKG